MIQFIQKYSMRQNTYKSNEVKVLWAKFIKNDKFFWFNFFKYLF